jgi:hypothetical protein
LVAHVAHNHNVVSSSLTFATKALLLWKVDASVRYTPITPWLNLPLQSGLLFFSDMNECNLRKVRVRSENKDYEGLFHCFVHIGEGDVCAIVEKEDGSVVRVYMDRITFIK